MIMSIISLVVFVGVIAAIYNFLNNDEPPRIPEADHPDDEQMVREARRKAARERRAKARAEKAGKGSKQ